MKDVISINDHQREVDAIRAEYLGRYIGAEAEIKRLRAALAQATAELSELKLDSAAAHDAACAALNNQQQTGEKP